MVARDGWRLLGDYLFDPMTGRWRHREGVVEPPIRLRDIRYAADGHLTIPAEALTGGEELLAQHLVDARAILAAAVPPGELVGGREGLTEDFEHLRWFDLPATALAASGTVVA